MTRAVTLTLPGERPLSWNQLYSGRMHWSERKAEATRVHALVRAAIDPDNVTMFCRPVTVTVTAYLKGRRMDADNVCSKLFIDGLIGWLIEDDSPRYVTAVTTRSRVDREQPRVEITVQEAS